MLLPLLLCLFVLVIILVVKFRKRPLKLLPEKKPAVSEPLAQAKTSKKVWKKVFSSIVFILIFLGTGFFLGKHYVYQIYSAPSQEFLKSDISRFNGQWELWILDPDSSKSKVRKIFRIVEVQSLEPSNFVFSLSYFHKRKKERTIFTWNKKKEEKGFWVQNNPAKKGFWFLEKLSDGFYSGWISIRERKLPIWLVRKEIKG